MPRPGPLPVELTALPKSLARFCDPKAKGPARLMAARGMVPIKGHDQVILLCQLAADADEGVAKQAAETLEKLPDNVLLGGCQAQLPPAFLDALAERFAQRDDVQERLVANPATAVETLAWIALRCSERVSERIAVNEQRLLEAPSVIEALYKNPHTRMSTADRLIDLCARNQVVLDIPTFQAHAQAIQGQLIPEPTEEPLPADSMFADALQDDDDNPNVVADGEAEEEVVQQYLPLMMRIRQMTSAEKLRLAMVGSAAARAFLVRDRDKSVAFAAISSPAMQENDVVPFVHSKEVGEDILRFVGNKREWTKNHEIKHGLVFNAKTPVGVALRFVGHLRDDELKALSRSRNVSQSLKSAALQRMMQKEKKAKGQG